jgi:dTDP-4-amino-4,6-dideoxygalactose transaminase/alpha-ketoglutarate-dependent taurine dioxygenase
MAYSANFGTWRRMGVVLHAGDLAVKMATRQARSGVRGQVRQVARVPSLRAACGSLARQFATAPRAVDETAEYPAEPLGAAAGASTAPGLTQHPKAPVDVYTSEAIPEAAREAIDKMLGNGDLFRYTSSSDSPVTLLENEFAAYMGSKYALAVSSCSAALFLSLKALGLKRDARVLIPAFTFAAVPSAVVHADCIPVLCEVGDNYRVDMADFEKKLDDSIDCVLISHMRGHTSDMDAIMKLAEARGLPVIEDAAHSLGTLWNGKKIGTIGCIGCFSFQSYKLVNAGEGGILITDDAELAAKCVIMSGAYEHNWQKHGVMKEPFANWQNQLPLYNVRMNNLSAAVIRPQISTCLDRRVEDGRANHDYVADRLNENPYFVVPPPLEPELRAPDSIQFNLDGLSHDEAKAFAKAAEVQGCKVQIFGLSSDNARAFWNWQFLGDVPDLPQTRAMLNNACDVRLPARLTKEELDQIVDAMFAAVAEVKGLAVTPPEAMQKLGGEEQLELPPLATGWTTVDDHLGKREVPVFDWPTISTSSAAPSEKFRHRNHRLLAGLTEEPGQVLGAILPAVKIAECHDWTEEDVQVLRDTIIDADGVLAFPNQSEELTVADHVEFTRLFGEPETHAVALGMPGHPEVLEIVREKSATVIFGENWHSDHSFQTYPASYSFLRTTTETPPYGTNNTIFCNTIMAYEALSPSFKRLINGLQIYHSAGKAYNPGSEVNSLAAMKQTSSMQLNDEPMMDDVLQPLVTVHPDTGKPTWFCSPTFSGTADGSPALCGPDGVQMSHEETDAIMGYIYEHMTKPEFYASIPWHPHQVTMWDNRQLIHKGEVDYTHCRRVVQRVSVGMPAVPQAYEMP